MDINFEYYKIFYLVAKSKSFTKAADKLFVSQPAVTQNIKKLEDELGRKLFYRTSKGIELTEEGKNLFNYLEDSIEILNNAEDKFRQYANMETGTIKIRTGSTNAKTVLYEPLKEFMKKYPKVEIELARGPHKESLKMLNNGEIDMVILNLPCDMKLHNIEIIPLIEKEYVFAMSKSYKEKNNVVINCLDDLNKYDLITSTRETTYRRVLEKFLPEYDKLNIKYQIMMESFKKELILEDLGIVFIRKEEIEEEIENGTVEVIKVLEEKMTAEIGVVIQKKDIRSFAAQKLLELMKEYVKNKE